MAHTISRDYSFSAAHQLEGHPKCGRIHGHNYKVTVAVRGALGNGMVMDYAVLDSIVKPLISEADHMYLASKSNRRNLNPFTRLADEMNQSCPWELPYSTAECIAEYLFARLGTEIGVTAVIVEETEKSKALYEGH